jgi:hypothetical protein
MPIFHPLIDRRHNLVPSRNLRKSQARADEYSAIAIETFVIACVVTLFGCFLYAFLSKHAEGLRMAWKYRDLDGQDSKMTAQARWSWWLYATPKQRADLARLIEENREKLGYYEKHAKNGGPPGAWDYVGRLLIFFFFFSWMFWALSEWIWPDVDEDGEELGCDEDGCVFQMCGLGLCVWMAASALELVIEFVFHRSVFSGGGTPEFVLIWVGVTSQFVKMVTPFSVLLYGVHAVWMSVFGGYALSGPDIVVLITGALAAACYYVNRDGFSDQENDFLAQVRTARPFAWYDKGNLYRGPLSEESETWWDEVESSVHTAPEAPPVKLTKSQRKAIGKQKEEQRKAEQAAQKRRERQESKAEKARARAIQEAARNRPFDGSVPDVAYEPPSYRQTLTYEQYVETNRVRGLARRTILRKRLAELEASSDEESDDGWTTDLFSAGYQGRPKATSPDKGSSHSDHVDAADLALQTQRNKEEAERQRRVREQREKEKAAQKEKEYSEAGPSHKEGAPKWEAPAPDEGDKAKREADKQASLLRKQEQQKERVKEKEAREKRESERLQSLKTGKRILQGNVQNRAPNNNNVQRSSLQPLREDEPAPTLTLADVALGFQENPRFQDKDDDLESVATTAVPAMLTQHASERAEEREYTEHQIKHTKKYGRVEDSNVPGRFVHFPSEEGNPKLVTDAEGAVITVLHPTRE